MNALLLASALVSADLPADLQDRLLAVSVELQERGFEEESDKIYEIATGGQFLCDDHPARCGGQLWSCEDYLAEGEGPRVGCQWEGGRFSEDEIRLRIDVSEDSAGERL